MPEERARALLLALLPSAASLDAPVLEYVCGVLADLDGAIAYDAVGELLAPATGGDDARLQSVCTALDAALAPASPAAPAPTRAPVCIGGLTLEEAGVPTRSGKVVLLEEATLSDKAQRRLRKEEAAAAARLQAQTTAAASVAAPCIQRGDGAGGSRDVTLERVCVGNGGALLIEDATLTLAAGRRYGLVGRNGTGKTTLLRALAGRALEGLPASLSVLHVEQEVRGGAESVLECVLACDAERSALLAESAALQQQAEAGSGSGCGGGGATRLGAVFERLEAIDAAGAPARAATILAGLSFDGAQQAAPTASFSGGWRMRVALARALFAAPDILLLDEPTNHLDVLAVIWLTDFLVAWPGTLVVVSHARSFLNEVCTDIVHLHARTLTTYRGDYDCFEATRAERQRNAAKAAEAAAVRRAQVQSFIDKFRFNAKRAALVQSRIKLLERMGEAADVEVDPETVFTFPEPAEASGALISFDDVCFTYAPPGGRLVFDAVTFGIDAGSRLAIVGPNGVGKSTLLGLVSGALQPTSGRVTRSPKLRVATFAQHHVDGLELGLTPLAALVRAFPGADHQLLRCHLGAFGVTGPLALQPMYTLSGGQKSRVAIAKVTWPRPNVLLLDEVTNHLDFDAVEALIEGLALWPGGLLLVSHDQVRPAPHVSRRSPPAWPRKWLRLAVSRARAYRPQHFIESVCDSMWVAEGGRLSPFDGTFSDYAKRLRKLLR